MSILHFFRDRREKKLKEEQEEEAFWECMRKFNKEMKQATKELRQIREEYEKEKYGW